MTDIPDRPMRPGIIAATPEQREVFTKINAELAKPWGPNVYSRWIQTNSAPWILPWAVRCYTEAGWEVQELAHGIELGLEFSRPTVGCAGPIMGVEP